MIKNYNELLTCKCYTKLKKYFKINSKKKENKSVSAPFQVDIKFLFEGFDVDIKNCEGFNKAIRSLLVDNILKTMHFSESSEEKGTGENFLISLLDSVITKQNKESSEIHRRNSSIIEKKLNFRNLLDYTDDDNLNNQIIYTALPYMLKNGYFNDAFILHEESKNLEALKDIMLHVLKNPVEYADPKYIIQSFQDRMNSEGTSENDTRKELDRTWASIKSMFSKQVHRLSFYGVSLSDLINKIFIEASLEN